jgi:3-methyl-2-oxobutanoate hydroxymethyltransferase
MNVLDFQKMKNEGRKTSMITCYDYSSARAVADSNVDAILVGDSVAMVMHGHSTTLTATTEMMALHTAAVAKGASAKFIVADLPFLSYRKGLKDAMDSVQALMSAGAHAVKLEGARGHGRIVRHIVDSGVPVMGDLGLTPQSINMLGGMKVQARPGIARRGRDRNTRRSTQDPAADVSLPSLTNEFYPVCGSGSNDWKR